MPRKKINYSPETHEFFGTPRWGAAVSKEDLARHGKKAVRDALKEHPSVKRAYASGSQSRESLEADLDDISGRFWTDWKNRKQK